MSEHCSSVRNILHNSSAIADACNCLETQITPSLVGINDVEDLYGNSSEFL